jgi:hypothetical protein
MLGAIGARGAGEVLEAKATGLAKNAAGNGFPWTVANRTLEADKVSGIGMSGIVKVKFFAPTVSSLPDVWSYFLSFLLFW